MTLPESGTDSLQALVERLDKLEARATKGPWRAAEGHEDEDHGHLRGPATADNDAFAIFEAGEEGGGDGMGPADAEFVAALRNAYPQLRSALAAMAKSTVTCNDCGFRYGAEHSLPDGSYDCPVCEVGRIRAETVEECARVCEATMVGPNNDYPADASAHDYGCRNSATAIRALAPPLPPVTPVTPGNEGGGR